MASADSAEAMALRFPPEWTGFADRTPLGTYVDETTVNLSHRCFHFSGPDGQIPGIAPVSILDMEAPLGPGEEAAAQELRGQGVRAVDLFLRDPWIAGVLLFLEVEHMISSPPQLDATELEQCHTMAASTTFGVLIRKLAELFLCNPHIRFAVEECARYESDPGVQHWNAVRHILVLVRICPSFGLTLTNADEAMANVLAARRARIEFRVPQTTRSYACGSCGTAAAAQQCSRCKKAWYCGADCQLADWKAHKKQCKKKCAQQQGRRQAHPGAGVVPAEAEHAETNNGSVLVPTLAERTCSGCSGRFDQSAFSGGQWKKGAKRRCKTCVDGGGGAAGGAGGGAATNRGEGAYGRVCWGCGTNEHTADDESGGGGGGGGGAASSSGDTCRFEACSLCVKRKMVASYFCSTACLKEHWPRHKQWHEVQVTMSKSGVADKKSDPGYYDAAEDVLRTVRDDSTRRGDEFGRLVSQGTLFLQRGKHQKAVNLLKRAVAIAPSGSRTLVGTGGLAVSCDRAAASAYFNLGVAYKNSNVPQEAAVNFVRAADLTYREPGPCWAEAVIEAHNAFQAFEGGRSPSAPPQPPWLDMNCIDATSLRVLEFGGDTFSVNMFRLGIIMGSSDPVKQRETKERLARLRTLASNPADQHLAEVFNAMAPAEDGGGGRGLEALPRDMRETMSKMDYSKA